MRKILFLLSISALSAFAAIDNSDVIWTWGNSKAIASVLSYLYFFLNIDTISVIIKYAALIGMFIVGIRELNKGTAFLPSVAAFRMFVFFAVTQAIVSWFLVVKQDATHRVYVLSANELSSASWAKCRPVNGDSHCYAPIGVKFVYSTLTNLERAGLMAMESAMMDSKALTYSFTRTGLGYGFSFYDEMSKAKPDPYAYNTFMDFYENCIIYDIAEYAKHPGDIYKSNNLGDYLLSDSGRLTTVFTSANKQGTLKACKDVRKEDFGNVQCTDVAKKLKAKLSGSPGAEGSVADACDAATNFTQMLFNSTKNADEQIKQRMFMNLTNEAMVNSAIASGIDPATLAYGTATAGREQESKWLTMGIMAKQWIPTIQGIMQGIAMALTWVLAIMAIGTAMPTHYIGSLIAFQMTLMVWSFILAILNFMVVLKMGDTLPNIFLGELATGDKMTLWSQATFDDESKKAMAFLGYMAVASYGIAAGLVKLGGNMLSTLGNGLSQLSVGMGVSANMAKGHADFGQTRSDATGTRSISRGGGTEVLHSSGQSVRENFEGLNTSAGTDGRGNTVTESSIDGKRATDIKTAGDSSATITDGNVTGVKLSGGVNAEISTQATHAAAKEKARAAQNVEAAEHSLSNARQSQVATSLDAVKAAALNDGKDATSSQQEVEKKAFGKALDEMVADKEITQEQAERAKARYLRVEGSAATEWSSSGTLGGKVLELLSGFSASAQMSGAGGIQHNWNDKHMESKALEVSFTDKFSKNVALEAQKAVSSSEKLDSSLRDELSSKISKSSSDTQAAQDNYKKAVQVSETASERESFVKQNASSISKNVGQQYLQDTYDKAGGGQAGEEAVKTELNRLESSMHAQNTFKEYTQGDNGLSDTVTKAIDKARGEVASDKAKLRGPSQRDATEDKADVQTMKMVYDNEAQEQHKNNSDSLGVSGAIENDKTPKKPSEKNPKSETSSQGAPNLPPPPEENAHIKSTGYAANTPLEKSNASSNFVANQFMPNGNDSKSSNTQKPQETMGTTPSPLSIKESGMPSMPNPDSMTTDFSNWNKGGGSNSQPPQKIDSVPQSLPKGGGGKKGGKPSSSSVMEDF